MSNSKPHTATLKKQMIKALEKTLGVVTPACKNVGIERSTHYRWMKADPEYKAQVDDLDAMAVDFSESALHKKIQSGNTTAIIFHLKTKGKSRGYVENVNFSMVDENSDRALTREERGKRIKELLEAKKEVDD